MSFVYAEKQEISTNEDRFIVTSIYSDTKITLDEIGNLNWNTSTQKLLTQYGMVKSIIVDPKCCISFAGNNIKYAHDLLVRISHEDHVSVDIIENWAYDIHINAPKDEIEFLICTADDDDKTHITCIKNGTILRDVLNTWIGSPMNN